MTTVVDQPEWREEKGAFARFGEQLAVTSRVIVAIAIRETKTRYGRSKLGYMTALIEPSIFIGIFIAIRAIIGRATPFGESLVLFMLTGLMTYRVFLSISSRLMGSFTGNRALLAYPPVKPVDILLARWLLEALTMFGIAALFFAGMVVLSEREVILFPANLLAAFSATCVLGGGLGFFNGAVCVFFPSWKTIFAIFRLPLLISSGIFYVPKTMPDVVLPFLEWNPLLHCVEWTRTGVYLTYDPMLDRTYPFVVGMSLAVIGLGLERMYRHRMLSA